MTSDLPPARPLFGEIDARNPRRRKITIRDVATLYGQRPHHPDLWYLSPYEFVMKWEPKLLSYPTSLTRVDSKEHHAQLTEAGRAKLEEQRAPPRKSEGHGSRTWHRLQSRRRQRAVAAFPGRSVNADLPAHVDPHAAQARNSAILCRSPCAEASARGGAARCNNCHGILPPLDLTAGRSRRACPLRW